ncbi:MAG: GNAT family N-acetyltransferase [Solirubrobacterales bacterium]
MALRATLSEDGGAAATEAGHFFRSPPFLAAEGVTHTLAIEGAGLALPVIVRGIPGSDRHDAISPYGYPGGTLAPGRDAAGTAAGGPDPAAVDWSATGLVSLFVRDRVGEPAAFAGGTVRSQLQVADPRAESGIRKRLREQIRRNERRGWTVAAEPGAGCEPSDRAAFERAYAETMARTGAAERYLFDSAYFERVLEADSAWLLLAGREGEGASAGAIAATSDHLLHYFLGGTADEALPDSPMKNLFAAMIALAGELGLPLNLGGGVAPGDSLDRFKRGFANAERPFRTHEIVCDPDAYWELSGATPADGFFPAYRASG